MFKLQRLGFVLLLFCLHGVSHALPQGGQIVGGSGSITQQQNLTDIRQHTQSLAINWNSFNLSEQDVVNFYQPSASSIALNRILSSNASQIFGQINANGRVVLVNSNGVFFGQTASVNVGGLIASGLDIGVNDFMNGDYRFNATDSADGIVKNSGTIQASLGGSVALLGKQVENSGYIGANLGSVALATGHQAVLSFDPEGLLGIRITDAVLHDELGVDPALVNSGEIEAAGGRVLLTASQSRDIFSNAVNHSSIEQATSAVVYEDGSFTLGGGGDVVNSGSISVSSDAKDPGAGQVVVLGENITSGGHITADAVNASGGDIELHANDTLTLQQNSLTTARSESDGNGGIILLLGQNVGLFGQSKVDASGSLDGGTVLMGGDQQGQNKYIRNAEFLYLGELTKINADSLDNGNGGKVIAFADDTARIYGSLSARGGSQGGDGGFIETSGKKGFQILSAPDVSAEHGTGGSWLIDPNNITIVGGNGFTNIFQSDSPSPPTNPFTTTDDGAVLGVDLIIDALMGNEVDVTITTANADADNSSSGVGTENGNITLATNLDFDGIGTGDSLTFNAIGGISINFNQRIEDGTGTDDSLNLNLYASGAVSIGGSAQVATNGGSLTVGYIDQNNSANNIIPSSFTNSGTINTSGLAGGDITISTSGDASLGSLDVHDTHPDGTTVSDYNGGGAILVNAGNDIIVSEEYDFNGTVGNLVGEDNTSITLNADNDINIEASIVDKSGSFWDTQNIILNADHDTSGVGTVNINANIYLGGGNLTVTGYGFDSSGYTINTDYSRSTGDNPTTNGGNVSLTMTGPVTLGSIITEQQSICGTGGSDICGNVSIKTGGAVSIGSSAQITTYGGGFTVEGWTDVASSTTYTPASFTMNSGSSISTTGGGNMAGGAITISTNIVDIGDPTLDGSIKITSLTANGGSAADAIGTSGLNGGEIKLLAEGDIDITGAVTSNGSVGDFHNEASAGYYGQNGGDGGAITLSSTSGSINVESTLSSLGGNGDGDSDTGVAADPANGGNGGEVKVTATSGTVSVAAISTRGGAAIGGDVSVDDSTEPGVSPGAYAKSGNGGNITIASGSITMSGNLDSRAGNLPSKGSAGAGGAISIQGDAVLASNIALNSNVGSGTNPPDVDGTDGSVTFTGTLNAQTSKIQTLDIDSGSINFQEIIGGTTPLGSLTLNATGVIDAGSNAITAASLFVTNSSSFTSGDIETSGTVVTGDAAGQNGGNITITSQDITVGALTTNGSDASGILDNNGGDGGAVSLTATHNDGTPSITLNGDINALGGGATGNGTVGSTGTKTISVNGSGSAEGSVIIGYTGIFTDSFTVAGNTSSDTLTGPTLTGTNSWDIDGEYDGTLNTKLTFTNFENLVGGSANDDFIFSSNGKMVSVDGGTGGTDSITGRYITNIWTLTGANEGSLYLQNGNSSPQSYIQTFLNIDTLSGNSASDTLQIDNSYNTALSWTINASGEGDLAHTFGGNGAISFTGMENLVGSPEVDSFTISDATASINIDGAGSSDSLIASSTGNNSWSINGSNSQTLVSDTSGAGTVTFTRIENLVGGALNDEFDFSGGGSAGSVTGNGGSNTIIGQNALNEWTLTTAQTGHVAIGGIDYIDNFSDIQILQGGTGTDTLTGRDVNNHWVIDVSNGNYVEEDVATPTDRVAFSEMENLVGGTSDDRFDFSAVGSVADIKGNGGSNTIIGQNDLNVWTLTTAQTGHVSIGGIGYIDSFSDIQILQGGTGIDTLTGRDVNNHWVIDVSNGNYVEEDVATPTDRVAFSEMENLVGGTSDDRFDFSAVGSVADINGNGGSNTIIGQNDLNAWTLTTAQTGHVSIGGTDYIDSFSDIQILQGGTGIDTLTGRDVNNHWVIDVSNGNYVEEDVATPTDRVAFSEMENLVGGTSDDRFDFSAGGSVVDINGNGGSNTIIGQNDLNAWMLTTAQTGHVAIGGTDYIDNFSDIQVLQGGTGIDTLTGRDVNNHWVIDVSNGNYVEEDVATPTDRVAFSEMENLVGGTSDDRFDFSAGGSIADINGNGGSNTIIGQNASNEWALTTAQTGHVSIGGTDYIDNFSDIQTLQGGTSTDTLTGRNVDNRWIIDTTNGGYVEQDVATPTDRVTFSEMENLTGGDGDDTFLVQSGGLLSGEINGGSESVMDSLQYSIADGVENAWVITDSNSGYINNHEIDFTDIESIQGNSDDDTFTISNINYIANIDGGNEDIKDVVDFSGLGSSFTVTMGTDTGFVNIEEFSGNAAHPEYGTLEGADTYNQWVISGQNQGTINGFDFSNFANLTGGTAIDEFTIDDAAIISTQMVLNGGKNTNSTDYDTLKGPNKNTFWTLDSSNTLADAATPANLNIQFTGFENLTAQGGDDSFRFIGSNTVIGTVDAGAGSDNIDLSGNTGIVRFNLANGFSRRVNFERVTGNGANSILIGNNIANTWFITHTAGDSQNDGVNDGQIGSLFFYDFANLTGGGDTDTFVFSDGSITGLIDGGLAASSVIDTVDLVQNSSGVTVQLSALADSTNSVLEVIRIDELKANPSYTSDNQLLGSNSSTNSWSLDGNASGTLNGVLDFVAFGKLTGQDDVVDNFTLANSAVGMAISGGGGSTRDTVTNAWTSASTWNIGDSSTYQGEVSTVMGELIQFSGFESLLGSNAATDTFNFYTGGSVASIAGGSGASYSDSIHSQVATDVIWRVDGTGSGEVNGVFTSFSGMEALYGGSGDDRFNMEVSGISIEIDGGANTLGDIVDYSGISVDTAVTVNLNSVSFTNIEQVKGNNNSTLIATNAPNSWLIDDENSGTLDGFRFVQFNKLTGGNDIDTFTVSGSGSLTGQINAGIGDDIINIALTPLYNGAISFVGGSGNDTLTVTGNSASTSKVTYSLLDTGFEQLSYSNVDATTYSVSFKETESVNDKFVASSLEINGGTGNDQIELGNQRFSVNSGADISFTGKTELVVDAAGDSDIIDLFEDIDMSGAQVSLSAESITTSNNAVLTADSLTLDTVASVGAASNYFLTNIDSLNLANVAGDVYLSNQGDLALTQFSTITGAVNLLSQSGGISNNVDIDENADLQLIAQNGDIDLQNIIHLQTLVLNGGNVAVNNGTHALSVNQINAASSISLISNGLDLIDSVSGSSLAISAGATEADIQGDVNISGSSGITATGITLSGDFLSGGDSQLNAGSGDINLQSSLTATGSANLTLTANSINQDSAIVSGAGDINLHAANTITMKTSVSSTAASGDIRYQADGGSIQVSSLTATQGTVSLLSPNGTIIDNNNNAVNVHADALVIESLGSIGSSRDDRFDTQVGGMDIVTTGAGSIWLNQSGDVEIIRLQATTGSNRIDIQSNANMLLNPGSVAVDRNSGVIVMATNNGGGILGNGTFDLGNPDITAFQGTFLALSGAFGSTGRPIVLDVPKTGEVFIQATTYGVMFSPETPDKLTKNGIDVGALGVIQSLSGEQLVEVETLGQVDPAIFTELRNYSIAEEPIRLPQDQSYEDDEEEANRVSLAL